MTFLVWVDEKIGQAFMVIAFASAAFISWVYFIEIPIMTYREDPKFFRRVVGEIPYALGDIMLEFKGSKVAHRIDCTVTDGHILIDPSKPLAQDYIFQYADGTYSDWIYKWNGKRKRRRQ